MCLVCSRCKLQNKEKPSLHCMQWYRVSYKAIPRQLHRGRGQPKPAIICLYKSPHVGETWNSSTKIHHSKADTMQPLHPNAQQKVNRVSVCIPRAKMSEYNSSCLATKTQQKKRNTKSATMPTMKNLAHKLLCPGAAGVFFLRYF